MRKIEWKKSLDEALTLRYVLTVDDRETTIHFTAFRLREEISKHGDVKAKQQLVEDVRNLVSSPAKGLTQEEQAAVVNGLSRILTVTTA